jgi:hypothetical protein
MAGLILSSCLSIFEEVESWKSNEQTNNSTAHRKRTSVTTVLPTYASKILNISENNHKYVNVCKTAYRMPDIC